MIALYLLASHLVGDFVFQTRWQAAGKLESRELRTQHVFFYGVAFLPVVLWRILAANVGLRGALFFALLLVLHYATDSRRFYSTVGDWVGWRWRTQAERRSDWVAAGGIPTAGCTSDSLPPNPWGPIPLMIDQSLHVVQIALLAGLLL